MKGFTYIGLLFAVVLLGVVLSAAGVVWDTEVRREKEQQLLFVGEQYRKAIASYAERKVEGLTTPQYPRTIDDLLEDRRGNTPRPVRHLRKRYPDPMTNSGEWGLVRVRDGIAAVHSRATEKPLKQSGFGSCCEGFSGARHYSDWKFGLGS